MTIQLFEDDKQTDNWHRKISLRLELIIILTK